MTFLFYAVILLLILMLIKESIPKLHALITTHVLFYFIAFPYVDACYAFY